MLSQSAVSQALVSVRELALTQQAFGGIGKRFAGRRAPERQETTPLSAFTQAKGCLCSAGMGSERGQMYVVMHSGLLPAVPGCG